VHRSSCGDERAVAAAGSAQKAPIPEQKANFELLEFLMQTILHQL